ncbi:hypothetical protein HN011_010578, partial [Eciton burchellii]|jgi:hypothetical protein
MTHGVHVRHASGSKLGDAASVAAQCIAPLGMESGAILDADINASSSFDRENVGPALAR